MTGSTAERRAQFALDRFGDPGSLARDIDLEPVIGRSIAAAAVGDDAGQVRADLRLDFRDDGRQGVAVIRIAGQRLGVGDEVSALRAVQRRGDRDLDAELVGPMRLTLADAFDLGPCRE
jgi:hypothetical protein